MAYVCDFCGYRNSEIKEGGGMSDIAKKITFTADCEEDLNRDVFKSDTARLCIPQVGLDMEPGTLGSLYTTIEGLVAKVISELEEKNPFGKGDSATDKKFIEFLDKMRDIQNGKSFPVTIILDDANANCFIYNPNAPEPDPKIVFEEYERTDEQNDMLGISHMEV